MKSIKSKIFSGVLIASLAWMTSCSDALDLAPIDYYGSGSYWKTEANVDGYIDGLHKHLRDGDFQHQIVFGELRGGAYKSEGTVSSDGMTMSYGDVRAQNFDADHTGVSKFGDLYGRITNCNLFIARVTDATFLSEAKKNYYLGIVYGLRAFYYFDLYRVYGGVPLRLGIEVIDGELDPNKLYKARSNPSEVMAQIKSDLDKSLTYFGDVTNFDPYSKGKKVYWSKAATECLAAEVYLWNSKVTIGDNKANSADLAVAKQHLLNVVANYGLKMLTNFSTVFDAKNNKANDEIIFAVRYVDGEASNNYGYYTYSLNGGQHTSQSYLENGTPWGDPLALKTGYGMQYEYDLNLFKSFDKEDSRRNATFLGAYRKNQDGSLYLYGIPCVKNIGYINAQDVRVMCSDVVYYRLPWVYLTLAEIANDEGINADVEKYINLVRERAYGANWGDQFKFTASDYTTNSLAILHEKDKEFVQEGQRWWDINRMTLTKGGKHLVFCKEASMNGLEPILNEATAAYKVLWPLDKTILGNDPSLVQTPGY